MMNVPASMRSGMMRCRAPCSLSDAFHANGRRSRALDLRAHLVEQLGQVGNLGLAGAILHHGLALGQSGRHQQVFRAGDSDLVENNLARLSAVWRVASM